MNEVVVYGVPGSPFMRSVLVALEEKHAPYRIEPLAPGAQRSAEYLRLHPFGRVPAIRHDGFELYETQAILRYVDAAFAGTALQPREAEAIGRMNQAIGINDWYLFPRVARVIVFERIVGPVLFGKTPDEQAIAGALPDARLCLGELDRLLGGSMYLAGADFSLADVQLAPQIEYLAATPEGATILAGTALCAWLARVAERASMRATLPPEALRRAA
ncbi:MAG TPA: glutathione S-transferase family protein [Gammaproteobacteria bacterium]|nr:glutathione S-transferase family protein [Gammaproteobacteria bacterium]